MPSSPVRWILSLAVVLTASSGCSKAPTPEPAPGAGIHWPADPGAERYRVQAWSGLTLLFEETVADTTLVLSPSMLRAIDAFDSVRVSVWSEGGPLRWMALKP